MRQDITGGAPLRFPEGPLTNGTKTEKTHAGTLVEIALARALGLADGYGTALDYTIAGADVDCQFSGRGLSGTGERSLAIRSESSGLCCS